MKRGFSHFAGDHAGTIWLEPGVSSEPGLIDTLAVAKTLWKHSGWRGVKAALSMDSIVQKHHPKEPHYYLFMIGAMEQARGQGLGSQLMRHSLERIDGEDMPAYLENSKEANIGFYQMHGFEIMDSVTLPHCPRHGAPVFWPMWRKRRSER